MRNFHKLLERQLRKYWFGKYLSPEFEEMLKAISDSYHYYDRDRILLERAMELSSRELMETNKRLYAELQQKHIAERKILEKDQILKSINENLREAVYRSSNNKIIFVNQAFIDLFGYDSEEEVLNTPPEKFYYSTKKRTEILRRLLKHKTVKSEEVLLKRKDGSEFWGLLSSMISHDTDGNEFFDGAIIDITIQKRNEEKLRNANEQLQKANSELDQFVYSASHDLRAPLKSLLGLVYLIEVEKGNDITSHLARLRQSILKLDNFIDDIIDYSRNTRLEMTSEPIDFKVLIEESFQHFKYMPHAESIQRFLVLDTHSIFYSDKRRLQIILNNLISNAISYRNPMQKAPYISISVNTSSDNASIVVSDNGIGIDNHHMEKIFNMFYRGTINSTGSGLGLYIVKEVLEKMKGRIEVSSEKNEGTRFTIHVPNLYKDYMAVDRMD